MPRLSKQEKAQRRDHRWRQLRWKRYKGDHDYWTRVVRANGFRVLPYGTFIEQGIPIGLSPETDPLFEDEELPRMAQVPPPEGVCPDCNGSGSRWQHYGTGHYDFDAVDCERCGGTGKLEVLPHVALVVDGQVQDPTRSIGIDLLSTRHPPEGVTSVDTTFSEPGPLQVNPELSIEPAGEVTDPRTGVSVPFVRVGDAMLPVRKVTIK